MPYSPRNITIACNHAGLTHYGGVYFFHEVLRVLQSWPYRWRDLHSSENRPARFPEDSRCSRNLLHSRAARHRVNTSLGICRLLRRFKHLPQPRPTA